MVIKGKRNSQRIVQDNDQIVGVRPIHLTVGGGVDITDDTWKSSRDHSSAKNTLEWIFKLLPKCFGHKKVLHS